MTANRDALHHLADALSEDVVHAPAETLLAEAAEDHGDARTLAAAFDRTAARAARQARGRRIAGGLAQTIPLIHPARSWRPLLASAAALFVAVMAGGLYVHERNRPLNVAAAPPVLRQESLSKTESQTFEQRLAFREEQRNTIAAPPAPAPVAPAATAQPSDTAAPSEPKKVRTIVIQAPGAAGSRGPLGDSQSAPQAAAKRDDTSRAVSAFAPASGVIASRSQPGAAAGESEGARIAAIAAEANRNVVASVAGAVPPFAWPARGRLIAGFGPMADGRQNDGINLALPPATDVAAAQDGVVVYAGSELKGYGNLVLVRHDGGFVTAYAHASKLLVKSGDKVRRGQPIAKSGQTGNVTEPQLHFEIRNGATPVDPAQYLPAPGGAR